MNDVFELGRLRPELTVKTAVRIVDIKLIAILMEGDEPHLIELILDFDDRTVGVLLGVDEDFVPGIKSRVLIDAFSVVAEGAEYCGCVNVDRPDLAMLGLVEKLVWRVSVSCDDAVLKRNVDFVKVGIVAAEVRREVAEP